MQILQVADVTLEGIETAEPIEQRLYVVESTKGFGFQSVTMLELRGPICLRADSERTCMVYNYSTYMS